MFYKKKPNKTGEFIVESIALAIDKLTTDIKSSVNSECNLERAKAILVLAEAYDTISGSRY